MHTRLILNLSLLATFTTTLSQSLPTYENLQGVLIPAIYDTDLTDLRNLYPQTDHKIYYEEPPSSSEGAFKMTLHAAFITFTNLTRPTVVLEHSSFIMDVSCSNTTIRISFSDAISLQYAFKAWSAVLHTDKRNRDDEDGSGSRKCQEIIFITNHKSCAFGYPAERGWLLVSSVEEMEGGGSVLKGEFVEVLASEVMQGVELTFGHLDQTSSSPLRHSASRHKRTPKPESKPGNSGEREVEGVRLERRGCSSDNCLRALRGGSVTAQAFCSSFMSTSASNTAITMTGSALGLYAKSCSNLSRMSSACSCLMTSLSSSLISTTTRSGSSTSSTSKSSSLVRTPTSTSSEVSPTNSSSKSSSSSQSSTRSSSYVSSTGGSSSLHSTSSSKSTTSSGQGSSSSESSARTISSMTSITKTSTTISVSASKTSFSSQSLSTSKPPGGSSSPMSLSPLSSQSSSSISSAVSSASLSTSKTVISTLSSTTSTSKPSIKVTITTSKPAASSTGTASSQAAMSSSIISQPTIQDFDTELDESLGFMDPNSATFWSQLLPGVSASVIATFGSPSSKRIRKRSFDLTAIANALNSAISSSAMEAESAVDSVYSSASNAISEAVANAVAGAVDYLNSLSPFSLGPFPFNVSPTPNVTSDFGPGIVLYQTSSTSSSGLAGNLNVYCIGCGATGSFSVTGTVIFSAIEGITTAYFDVAGNINAQIELAMVASLTTSAKQETNIFTQGLPALTIPGFLVIGPAVSLDVGTTVAIQAVGGLAAGYGFNWPSITAHFDIMNDVYSGTGFTPTTTPIFNYEAKVAAQASAYGLISITFGIDIMKGKYKANVGLVDKPEVDAAILLDQYTDYQLSQMADGTVICVGEQFTLGCSDSVYADVVYGGVSNKSSTKTWSPTSWAGPTFTTCFGSLSTITHSSTSITPTPTPTYTTSSTATPATSVSTVFSYPTEGCDPIALVWGGHHECCPIAPATLDNGAEQNVSEINLYINCMYNEGYYGGQGQADLCYIHYPTQSEQLACVANISAQIPTIDLNCPPDTSDDDTFNTMAMVCSGESLFWRYFNDTLILSTQNYIIAKRDKPFSTPVNLPAFNQDDELHGKRDGYKILPSTYPPSSAIENEKRTSTSPGLSVSIAQDLFNSTTLLAISPDGNLIADNLAAGFSSLGGSFMGDFQERLLHLYSDELSAYGVSRLRMATLNQMPVGSVLVTLTPLNILSTPKPVLVAFTSAGNYYYIVTCVLDSQLPKLFLVQDLEAGIGVLMDGGVNGTITGGDVEECGLLRWEGV